MPGWTGRRPSGWDSCSRSRTWSPRSSTPRCTRVAAFATGLHPCAMLRGAHRLCLWRLACNKWRHIRGMIWGLFTHVQLPFYIASSKAPHRVSRVAEKQLVRVWLRPFGGRVMSTACQYHMHVLCMFNVELRMNIGVHFALLCITHNSCA
jgi:hypothetical protein